MDVVLLARQTCVYISLLTTKSMKGALQNGLVSSHFFFRFRHVVHPVFDRAFVAFDVVGDLGGYIRGRPRPRLIRTGSVGDIGGSSVIGSVFTSDSSSSRSSTLGTIPSNPLLELSRNSDGLSVGGVIPVSNVGVFIGESLQDDMEGWGDELMLRRACAPGGGCPKERVEIIRSGGVAISMATGAGE